MSGHPEHEAQRSRRSLLQCDNVFPYRASEARQDMFCAAPLSFRAISETRQDEMASKRTLSGPIEQVHGDIATRSI